MSVEAISTSQTSAATPSKDDIVESVLATLETVLPHAARTVEEKTQALVTQISTLVTASAAQEAIIAALSECLARMEQVDSTQIRSLLHDAKAHARTMAETGRAAITTIQFQDYHTQLQENAVRLLGMVREATARPTDMAGVAGGHAFFNACYAAISLSEIRSVFLEKLNYIPPQTDAEIHVPSSGTTELF